MAGLALDIREKRYPGAPRRLVLADVAITVAPGELVALVGPSGCGKTTLLNIAAGLDRDFAGTRALGPRPDGTPPRIGYVFQEPRLLPWRTARQNLALVLRPEQDPAIVDRLLAEVGLAEQGNVYPPRLSLGMSRRVAIARAFAIEPDLLLMDEPFVSLDEATGDQLRGMLVALRGARPAATLLVTHDLREALALADRLVLLSAAPGRRLAALDVDLAPAARRDPAALEARRAEIARTHRGLIAAEPLGAREPGATGPGA